VTGHDAARAVKREHKPHRAAEHADHRQRHEHLGDAGHADVYRRRFWIILILALPVVVYSEMIQDWFGFTAPQFPGDGLVAPVLGTVIYVYGGSVFLTGAWSELRQRAPGMMTLVSLAITVAFLASAASAVGLFDLEFWWELSALVVVMLLGHWQEMKALGQARGALSALAELLPDEAERVRDGKTERVPLDELESGDVVLVRPGARVPADGAVIAGRAELDESMITGESKPVTKGEGDKVTAGSSPLAAWSR
jgi:Cu2+-exporting ATPase